ncbi:MAG: hypothetical protein EP344_18580 [Bacteroidetes bacterium]|nr:MAG: hypothetical protein EP344_18580 [Bacteroidota bacterium]
MEHPQHELIDQYLEGSLSPEARAAFEARLAAEPELAQALRLHEAARAAVEMQSFLDRRDALQTRGLKKLRWQKWQWKTRDVLEQLFVRRRTDGSGRLRIGLITGVSLATIALIVLLVRPELFMGSFNGGTKPRAVPKEQAIATFNQYYQRVALPTTLGGAEFDSLYRITREQYRQVDCTNTLYNLQFLLADSTFADRPLALLLQGTCLIDQDKPVEARISLEQIPPAATLVHKEAQWYIALSYLLDEQMDEATARLRKIAVDSRQPHQAEARAILKMDQ